MSLLYVNENGATIGIEANRCIVQYKDAEVEKKPYVRKGAKVNYQNKIDAKICDIRRWIEQPKSASDYSIQELLKIEKEAIDNNAKYDKQELDKFIKYNKFIRGLEILLNNYLNKNG